VDNVNLLLNPETLEEMSRVSYVGGAAQSAGAAAVMAR
jgi:hypothetical protein